jgi:hypothetical protein
MGEVLGSGITRQNFRLHSAWRAYVSHKPAWLAGPWLNLLDIAWHLARYAGGNILDMRPIPGFYYRFRLWPSVVSY